MTTAHTAWDELIRAHARRRDASVISVREDFEAVGKAYVAMLRKAPQDSEDPDVVADHATRILDRMRRTPHGPKRSRLAEQHINLSNRVHYLRGLSDGRKS